MSDKKFDPKKYEKLDSPKRRKILPVENILKGLGEIDKGIVVADIGCGIGYLTLPLADRLAAKDGKVLAIDISEEMLHVLKDRIGKQDNIQTVISKESTIPISKGKVDLSFLVTVFHELEDHAEFIKEIKRVSKDEHRVVIVDWNTNDREMGPPSSTAIAQEKVIEIFSEQGYECVDKFIEDDNFYGLTFSN